MPAFPKKKPVKPNVQMRQLHWTKVPDAKVKGTMWEKDMSDEHVVLDKEEMESLFAAQAAKKKTDDADEAGTLDRRKTMNKKPEVVTLLDPKTANNTAIALSRFKAAPEQIAAALLTGDSTMLTDDVLTSLMASTPAPARRTNAERTPRAPARTPPAPARTLWPWPRARVMAPSLCRG